MDTWQTNIQLKAAEKGIWAWGKSEIWKRVCSTSCTELPDCRRLTIQHPSIGQSQRFWYNFCQSWRNRVEQLLLTTVCASFESVLRQGDEFEKRRRIFPPIHFPTLSAKSWESEGGKACYFADWPKTSSSGELALLAHNKTECKERFVHLQYEPNKYKGERKGEREEKVEKGRSSAKFGEWPTT